jgi:HlyD family secretion protein
MEVDETSILREGEPEAKIRIDAYPNRTFRVRVTGGRCSPIPATTGAGNTARGSRSRCRQGPARASAGLSVQADILTGFRAQALVVPIQSLVVRDREKKPGDAASGTTRDEEGVFLMESGKARFQPIQTGLLGELSLEVRSGLKGGETLITGPFKSLRELKLGDPVKVEKPKKDEEAKSQG